MVNGRRHAIFTLKQIGTNKVAPKLWPAGMSNQEDWDDKDQIDMGDQLAVADKPPTIKYGRIEGAIGKADVPTISMHPPNPTHSSTPDSSPVADEEMGTVDPDQDSDRKEAKRIDIIMEEEYYEQEDDAEADLDYEDDVLVEEPTQVDEYQGKHPGVWRRLGDPVEDRMSTDTETGEMASLMQNVLGIQGPEGSCEEDAKHPSSRHSEHQHTAFSNDGRRSKGYSSDSSRSSSHSTNSKTSKRQREHKAVGMSGVKLSSKLEVPEATTPHQSPQQK